MCADKRDVKPNLLLSVFQNRCPRCRRGAMFQVSNPYKLRTVLRMNERCLVCGQPLDVEPGFYYGTNMISYTLAVIISGVTFVVWLLAIGFPTILFLVWWLVANAVLLALLQPPLMRLSRSVWIYFFIPYSHRWQEGDIVESERVNKEHQNNW